MLVIRFGKWSHKATSMFLYTRIFRNGCEWTPLCIKKLRYVEFNTMRDALAMLKEQEIEEPHVETYSESELIKCKDCKKGSMDSASYPYFWCSEHMEYHKGDYYCADGERKD